MTPNPIAGANAGSSVESFHIMNEFPLQFTLAFANGR